MPNRLTIRYGGVPDLDRTVALQSGEVAPAGIAFEYSRLERPVDLSSGLPEHLEAMEASLYDFVSLISRGDKRVIGIPVFTARYLPSQLLWARDDKRLEGLRDFAGTRIGFNTGDKTTRVWAAALLGISYGVDDGEVEWVELSSDEELLEASNDLDAICFRPPARNLGLVPAAGSHHANSDQLTAFGGVLPIFHLVVVRRDVYEENRWIALELTDAFIRAKFRGVERLRYFGALAVGLPWLRRAINDIDTNFDGDAYPYGLSENLDNLKHFVATALRAELIDNHVEPADLFAKETVDYLGVPNPTAYVVPLSGAHAWSSAGKRPKSPSRGVDKKLTVTYGGFVHPDRTLALFDGSAEIEGVELNAVPVPDIGELFRRMAQFAEFDAAEMSLSTLMVLISRGRSDLVGIPIFPSRSFRHGFIFVRPEADIQNPADLRGKRVGIQHYQATAYLWMRALLEHEYDVSAREIEWWEGGLDIGSPMERFTHDPPSGVTIKYLSGAETLEGMISDGRLDAIMSPEVLRSATGFRPQLPVLWPNHIEMEADYFKRTGLFPIMHTVVLRRALYEENPWLARAFVDAFEQAKRLGMERLTARQTPGIAVPGLQRELDSLNELFDGDAFPSGFRENRDTIETMTTYALEQSLTPKRIHAEELFAAETLSYSPVS